MVYDLLKALYNTQTTMESRIAAEIRGMLREKFTQQMWMC